MSSARSLMRCAHVAIGFAIGFAASLAVGGGPVLASDAAGARTACDRDVERLCGGSSVPDERRILACLLPDRTRLSPACRRAAEPITVAVQGGG